MRRHSSLDEIALSRRVESFARRRTGFTLIELLLVIAIMGLLLALLLPTVQTVREAANRAECANNLKQLAMGCLNHYTQQRQLPTGGWGYWWNGDPDRGANHRQTGGWGFNVLPYIEQNNLYNLGTGMAQPQKGVAIQTRIGTPLKIFNCPSRRLPDAYPNNIAYYDCPFPANGVGRSDYAACAGNILQGSDQFGPGPATLAAGDDPAYPWPDPTVNWNGPIYQRSEISLSDFPRGTGNTYLLGEKYLNPDSYANGLDGADNENLYTGFDNDNQRSTVSPPLRDLSGLVDYLDYGSAHFTGLNMAYCDGSVKFILYTVDPQVHFVAGSRY